MGIRSGRAFAAAEGCNDRGVALVITLLLLFLLSVIGLAAVMTGSSDLLINNYYSNYRGSFYAADSGLNIARQAMYNQLNSTFTTDFSTFVSPPPAGISTLASTVPSNILTNYGGGAACPTNPPSLATKTTCVLNAGTSANSWAESFKITNATLVLATGFTNPIPTYTCVSTPGTTLGCPTAGYSSVVTAYRYIYNYSLTSVGSATGAEQSTVTENGSITINVGGTPASYNASFSIFGAFITNWAPCTLGWLVPGTMTGTMFTDGSWGFGGGGGYLFTDPVGQADPDASYWVDGCNEAATSSYKAPDGEISDPTFQDGFSVGQAPISQPTNSYSQQWAALDGVGCGEGTSSCASTNQTPSQPQTSDLQTYSKDINGNAYTNAPGVYLDYQSINGTLTMAGGGLYVQGNASIGLAAQTATNGDLLQVFTVTTQNGTTTTMTVDPSANNGVGSTVLTSGSTTLTLSGVPANCTAAGNRTNLTASPPTYCTSSSLGAQPATMVYVNGTITSMSGPGEGVGAIQDGAAVNITALGDINITGDVVYKSEPVTTAPPSTLNGPPIDSLIQANDHNQDLGIFTANGSIYLSSPYNDDNLQVDGSQAVIGSTCAANSCGFYVTGCINTFNNVGGQIQTNIFGACLNTENTYYDRRYTARPGFAPPWFPATTITNIAGPTTSPPQITVQRLSWVSSSGQ